MIIIHYQDKGVKNGKIINFSFAFGRGGTRVTRSSLVNKENGQKETEGQQEGDITGITR